jgi:hypothetical protein
LSVAIDSVLRPGGVDGRIRRARIGFDLDGEWKGDERPDDRRQPKLSVQIIEV